MKLLGVLMMEVSKFADGPSAAGAGADGGRPPSERTTPRKKGALLDADGGFAGNGGSDADDD